MREHIQVRTYIQVQVMIYEGIHPKTVIGNRDPSCEFADHGGDRHRFVTIRQRPHVLVELEPSTHGQLHGNSSCSGYTFHPSLC